MSEFTPLVKSTHDSTGAVESLQQSATTSATYECKFILRSSIPLIITFFLQYSLTVVSIFSVGHIGKTELASVSLAIMTFNVTVSIFNGMATCLDTLCSLAFGAGKYNLVGMQFQRCTAMILVFSIPVVLLWTFSGLVLRLIIPEEEKGLIGLAQTYLRYISFGSPGYILFETGKRFLQAQGIYHAGQYCLFVVAPFNIALNYFLVWDSRFGLGFIGAPISTAISYWLMAAFLFAYAVCIDGKQCWNGLHIREAFDVLQWSHMVGLALNGTAMLLLEMIAFEILTLIAARFGTSSLAAQSIVSTMATLSFQIPFGASVAVSSRVAHYVGAGHLVNARLANRVAYYLLGCFGVTNCLALVIFRHRIAHLFTDDKEVIDIAVTIILILGINQMYDCANVIFAGCLRGQGRQKIGSSLNLIAYYLVAIPLANLFAFVLEMKLVGLWMGLGVGVLSLACAEAWFLYKADWRVILEEARLRNKEDHGH